VQPAAFGYLFQKGLGYFASLEAKLAVCDSDYEGKLCQIKRTQPRSQQAN
jgi:hypothetical protein